jgi:hypothetical protein
MRCSLAWQNQIFSHDSFPLINGKFRGGYFLQAKLRVKRIRNISSILYNLDFFWNFLTTLETREKFGWVGVGGKGVWAVGDPFYWHGDYSP